MLLFSCTPGLSSFDNGGVERTNGGIVSPWKHRALSAGVGSFAQVSRSGRQDDLSLPPCWAVSSVAFLVPPCKTYTKIHNQLGRGGTVENSPRTSEALPSSPRASMYHGRLPECDNIRQNNVSSTPPCPPPSPSPDFVPARRCGLPPSALKAAPPVEPRQTIRGRSSSSNDPRKVTTQSFRERFSGRCDIIRKAQRSDAWVSFSSPIALAALVEPGTHCPGRKAEVCQ